MNPRDKVAFLKGEIFLLCNGLKSDSKGKWGKMNAQQMIEHVADFFDVSSDKKKYGLVTPEEHLPKFKAFLHSDKEFRENTMAPENIVPIEPLPVRHNSIEASIKELKRSVEDFFTFFEEDPLRTTVHPVFGPLNFEEWVLLHYKHVNHHLRQFQGG